MIQDVDASLRELIKREVVNGSEVEVSFEAPTSDWSARRNAPTIDVYLYDIREEIRFRQQGSVPERNKDGFVAGHRALPRWFKLSYLVTAWTQRPEDEHRLLAALLAAFIRADTVPRDVLAGQLAEQAEPVVLTVALPPPQDRSLSDVWSALGGDLKPSLDVCVTCAFDTDRFVAAGPPVLETPRLRMRDGEGVDESKVAKGGRSARPKGEGGDDADADPQEALQDEAFIGGDATGDAGRMFRMRGMPRPDRAT